MSFAVSTTSEAHTYESNYLPARAAFYYIRSSTKLSITTPPVLDDFDERIDQLEANIFGLEAPEQYHPRRYYGSETRRVAPATDLGKAREVLLRMSRGEDFL